MQKTTCFVALCPLALAIDSASEVVTESAAMARLGESLLNDAAILRSDRGPAGPGCNAATWRLRCVALNTTRAIIGANSRHFL
jgi:hypothetical protein